MPAKKKKTAPKKKALPAVPKTPISKITPDQQIVGAKFLGKIVDYYAHVGVITFVAEAPLAVGDMIRIKGHSTDITQKVESMQIEHQSVQTASAGDGVGIKIVEKARIGDAVYKC
jgi:putative protease